MNMDKERTFRRVWCSAGDLENKSRVATPGPFRRSDLRGTGVVGRIDDNGFCCSGRLEWLQLSSASDFGDGHLTKKFTRLLRVQEVHELILTIVSVCVAKSLSSPCSLPSSETNRTLVTVRSVETSRSYMVERFVSIFAPCVHVLAATVHGRRIHPVHLRLVPLVRNPRDCSTPRLRIMKMIFPTQSDVELRAASRMRGVGSDGQATSYPTHAPFEMEDAMPMPAMERIRSNPNPRGEGASATAAGGRSRGMRAVKQQPTRARAQSVPDAEAGDVIGDGGVMGSRMDSRGGGIAGERRDSMTASSPARANSMQDLSPSVLVSPRLAADRGGGDSGGGYGDGHPMEISPHPSEADSPYGRHTTRITPNGRSLDPMDVTGAPHDHHSQHHHGYPHHHAPLPTLRDLGTGAGSGNSGGGGSGASSGYRGFPESGGRTPPGGSRGEHGQGSSGGYSPARYVGDGSGPGGGGGASGGFSTPGHHRSGSGGGGGNGIGSFHAEVGMFHTSFSPIRVRRARGDSGSGSAGGPDVFRLGSPTKRGSSSSAGAGVGDGGVGGGHGQEGGGRSSAYVSRVLFSLDGSSMPSLWNAKSSARAKGMLSDGTTVTYISGKPSLDLCRLRVPGPFCETSPFFTFE